MPPSPSVRIDKRGPALWITIDRPERRNALNAEVVAGIAEGFRTADADRDVRAIVLTGAGDKAFCAGADLAAGGTFAFDPARPHSEYADLLRLALAASKPSLARVNGACLAGGMGLLAMTDIAVASETATFGLPEVKVGLFPMQALSALRRLVPERLVAEWALTGESFGAQAAREAGLVNHIVPAAELDAKVERLVARIAENSPTAIRRGKYALKATASMSFEESLAFMEGQLPLLALTEDAKEGLAAFVEKRKPAWPGR